MNSPSRIKNTGGHAVTQPAVLRPRQSLPKYFYVYDVSLSEPKHANALARIETRLTDLELQGRVGRLGPLKSAKEMIASALKAGATTIVAVGNDRTFTETLNAVAESEATLGVIPMGKPSELSWLLGIPEGEAACEVLAARKTEVVDLGKTGPYYFLSDAEVHGAARLECDGHYTLEASLPDSRLTITNLQTDGHCQDGRLEIIIESSKPSGWFKKETHLSIVPVNRVVVSPLIKDEGTLFIERAFTLKLPAAIEVIPAAIKIIVGKNRVF